MQNIMFNLALKKKDIVALANIIIAFFTYIYLKCSYSAQGYILFTLLSINICILHLGKFSPAK